MKAVGVCLVLLVARGAAAQPDPPPAYPAPPGAPASPQLSYQPPAPATRSHEPYRDSRPSGIYGEVLGKGLIYSVGYDYALTRIVAIGASFSYLDPAVFVSPYLTIYPVGGWRSALMLQAGLQLVNISSKPNDLLSELLWEEEGFDVGGQVSIGYEFRSGFLFRVALLGMFNKNGFLPWPGLTFGGSF
jgi:hypothetical protein